MNYEGMSDKHKPKLPLSYGEVDACCSCIGVTYDGDKCELNKEEVEWINDRLQQPTIADYIKDNEEAWKKCHRSMVSISELKRIAGVE